MSPTRDLPGASDDTPTVHTDRKRGKRRWLFGGFAVALATGVGLVYLDANGTTLVFAMIETPEGLANVKEICATPGLDVERVTLVGHSLGAIGSIEVAALEQTGHFVVAHVQRLRVDLPDLLALVESEIAL